MKTLKHGILITLILIMKQIGYTQGFTNLNFESANVSGYSPDSEDVPITKALPGWSAYISNSSATNTETQVWYDGISLASALISVVDTNVPFSYFDPLQGRYSVDLFGGDGG